jgi:hypothetical protein
MPTGRLCSLLVLLLWAVPPLRGQLPAGAARAAIDHVILGINSLERGIRAFESLTGVAPRRGGEHPGAGTENALVSLGDGAYLELLAPKPGATPTSFALITSLERLTPIGWALHTDSLEVLVARLRAAKLAVLGPFPGSRRTPDGNLLSWRTAHLSDAALQAAPFLIEWGTGVSHPSSTSPGGCRLTKLSVGEPSPSQLNAFFELVGMTPVAEPGATRGLSFTLECPRGNITFSS